MKKLLILQIALLSSCAVGPNYRAPEPPVENEWVTPKNDSSISTSSPILNWWKVFEDPLLETYIHLAIEYNQDVLAATSTILQAKAFRKVVASSFYPQIGANVNAIKTYFSKNGPIFSIGPATGSIPGTVSNNTGLPFAAQTPQIQSLFNLLFDVSWEIDLFGKTKRAVEAANAKIESAIQQKDAILISIMAEIARNYMELRSFQKKITLLKESVHLLKQKAFIIQKQYQAGYKDRLEYENIQRVLSQEKGKIPHVRAQIYQNIYILSTLTGSTPETLLNELLLIKPIPKVPSNVAIGLKSDLLRRRPDVRKAERDLAAATANIGLAVASFFPSFILIGDGGLQSLSLAKLFSWDSRTWAAGGDLNLPLFQGGRLKGNLSKSYAEANTTFHIYQQTVLKALQEAESTLMTFIESEKTLKERKKATHHSQQLVTLSQARAVKGLTNLLNLLDAKQNLLLSKQSEIDSHKNSLLSLISLYKALGGSCASIKK